jgi:signal transduction histidine kinase
VREVRSDPALREVPVVMLTAKGDSEDRFAAGERGVDAYLTKPFHPAELLHLVRNLLRRTLGMAETAEVQRDSALRTLALGIAHEILNPLGFLQSGAFLLNQSVGRLADRLPEGEPTDEVLCQAREAYAAAIEGVERVRAAVEELRLFANGAAVDSAPAEPCSLDEVVRRIVTLTSAAGGLSISLGDTPAVPMRRAQIERLVLHLVVNARQAGGPRVQIRLRTWTEAGGVALSVSDDGPGIPSALRDQIFSPFFTTRPMGTGLGLAMARQIAWGHGGRLALGSGGEGPGATFVLRLPFEAPPTQMAMTPGAIERQE